MGMVCAGDLHLLKWGGNMGMVYARYFIFIFFIQRRWSQAPAVTSPQPEDDRLQCVMSSSSVSWCRRFCQRELQLLLMTDLAAAA